MKYLRKLKSKGFTLVELLLAIFILEIGLLGVAGFYFYTFQITKIARLETTGANLASGVLDENLAASYDNLTVEQGSTIPYTTDSTSPFVNYSKKIDVAYINTSLVESYSEPDTHMKKITVTIFWNLGNEEKNFQIASIKAEH